MQGSDGGILPKLMKEIEQQDKQAKAAEFADKLQSIEEEITQLSEQMHAFVKIPEMSSNACTYVFEFAGISICCASTQQKRVFLDRPNLASHMAFMVLLGIIPLARVVIYEAIKIRVRRFILCCK